MTLTLLYAILITAAVFAAVIAIALARMSSDADRRIERMVDEHRKDKENDKA